MLFDDEETRRLNSLLAASAKEWSAAELRWARDYAKQHQPPGYHEWASKIADLYQGNSAAHFEVAAAKRFPKRSEMLKPFLLNRLKHVCAADSGVYRLQPLRELVRLSTGEVLQDQAARFAQIVKDSGIVALGPEIERRAIGAQTLFVRPRWVKGFGRRRSAAVVDIFWPRDVAVVCWPADPANLDAAVLIIARVAQGGVAAASQWFAMWVREPIVEAGELVGFSPWRVHLVSSDGRYAASPTDDATLHVDASGNPLPSPWTCIRVGVAEGSVYVDPDRDLPDFLLQLNVDAASERLSGDLQGHTPIVYAGEQLKKGEISWGPGEVTKIGDGESMTTLTMSPALEQMRATRVQFEKDLAKIRRNNPNAYVTDAAPPESGVARLIAQAPHEAVLDELEHVFRDWEEQQLWPVILALYDAHSGEPPFGDDVAVRVTMRRAPPVEEAEAKTRRLQAEVDAGIISVAQMAVELGRFGSVAEAEAKGLSNALKAPPRPMPAALQEITAPAADEAEDEAEAETPSPNEADT